MDRLIGLFTEWSTQDLISQEQEPNHILLYAGIGIAVIVIVGLVLVLRSGKPAKDDSIEEKHSSSQDFDLSAEDQTFQAQEKNEQQLDLHEQVKQTAQQESVEQAPPRSRKLSSSVNREQIIAKSDAQSEGIHQEEAALSTAVQKPRKIASRNKISATGNVEPEQVTRTEVEQPPVSEKNLKAQEQASVSISENSKESETEVEKEPTPEIDNKQLLDEITAGLSESEDATVQTEQTQQSELPKESTGYVAIACVHGVGDEADQQNCYAISDIADTALTAEKGVFAVVADGGGKKGAQVSLDVVSYMLEAFVSGNDELESVAQEANRSVLSKCGRHSHASMVALNIKNNELFFVSAGDCTAQIIRGEFELELNRKHTNISHEYEQIAIKGMKELPQKIVTSFIGAKDMELDMNFLPIGIENGDKIMLMSCGASELLEDVDVGELLRDNSIRACAQQIQNIISANDSGGVQNYTVVLLEVLDVAQ